MTEPLLPEQLVASWPHEYCANCGRDHSKKAGFGCCAHATPCHRCQLEAALRVQPLQASEKWDKILSRIEPLNDVLAEAEWWFRQLHGSTDVPPVILDMAKERIAELLAAKPGNVAPGGRPLSAHIEHNPEPWSQIVYVVAGTHSQIAFFNRESAERWKAERTEPDKYAIHEFVRPAKPGVVAPRPCPHCGNPSGEAECVEAIRDLTVPRKAPTAKPKEGK